MAPPDPPPMPPEGTKNRRECTQFAPKSPQNGVPYTFYDISHHLETFSENQIFSFFRVFKHFHTRLVTKSDQFFGGGIFSRFFHFFDQSSSLFDASRFLVGKPRGGLPQKTVLNRSRTVSMSHEIGFLFSRKCWVFGATPRDNSREWSLRGCGGSDLSLAGL